MYKGSSQIICTSIHTLKEKHRYAILSFFFDFSVSNFVVVVRFRRVRVSGGLGLVFLAVADGQEGQVVSAGGRAQIRPDGVEVVADVFVEGVDGAVQIADGAGRQGNQVARRGRVEQGQLQQVAVRTEC